MAARERFMRKRDRFIGGRDRFASARPKPGAALLTLYSPGPTGLVVGRLLMIVTWFPWPG
jgi:hypothetical protein